MTEGKVSLFRIMPQLHRPKGYIALLPFLRFPVNLQLHPSIGPPVTEHSIDIYKRAFFLFFSYGIFLLCYFLHSIDKCYYI